MSLFDPTYSAAIPAELRAIPRWVNWRYGGTGDKRTKEPFNPHSPGHHASTTDPTTWSTFDHVVTVAVATGLGIGFVFIDDGIFGLDVDHLDSATTPVTCILKTLPCTYVEISPSGNGLHLYGYGVYPRA